MQQKKRKQEGRRILYGNRQFNMGFTMNDEETIVSAEK